MEEEGARAVEHLLAVRARRLLGHVAATLSPVLGGRRFRNILFVFLTNLVVMALKDHKWHKSSR